MHTAEFITIVKDSCIHLPKHENFNNKQVRVIILEDDSTDKSISHDDFISKMIKNPKHISADLIFMSRDEANER